jgi:hypothetical protein
VLNEIQISINNSKNQLNAIVEDILRKRMEVYKDNNIDVLIRLATMTKSQIGGEQTGELEQKISDIKSIHGGYLGYQDLINQLKKYEQENDQMANEMKTCIEEDYRRDMQFKQQTGFSVLDIKQASNGLLLSFEKHGKNLTAVIKAGKKIKATYSKYEQLLKDIDNGEALKNYQNLKVDLTNNPQAQALVKRHQILDNIFKIHIETQSQTLKKDLENIKPLILLNDVFVNNKTMTQVYEKFSQDVE